MQKSGWSLRAKEQKDRRLEGSRHITLIATEIDLMNREALKSNMSKSNVLLDIVAGGERDEEEDSLNEQDLGSYTGPKSSTCP